jgi:putative addiction module component (TIGR02574 family)
MSLSFDDVSANALSLPPDLRFVLAQRLWESVEDEAADDEALFAEIERRCAEMDAGVGRTYSHEEVMKDSREAAGE